MRVKNNNNQYIKALQMTSCHELDLMSTNKDPNTIYPFSKILVIIK